MGPSSLQPEAKSFLVRYQKSNKEKDGVAQELRLALLDSKLVLLMSGLSTMSAYESPELAYLSLIEDKISLNNPLPPQTG